MNRIFIVLILFASCLNAHSIEGRWYDGDTVVDIFKDRMMYNENDTATYFYKIKKDSVLELSTELTQELGYSWNGRITYMANDSFAYYDSAFKTMISLSKVPIHLQNE